MFSNGEYENLRLTSSLSIISSYLVNYRFARRIHPELELSTNVA